jgi:hypothetical protein
MPAKIAVTVARRVTYLGTPYKLKESQWDGENIINSANASLLNTDLRHRMADLEKRITLANMDGIPVTPAFLKGTSSINLEAIRRAARQIEAALKPKETLESDTSRAARNVEFFVKKRKGKPI